MPKIAVCGGIYANPSALSAMAADARERSCERIVCLGDLGGFGAEPDAVWPLLQELGIECIAGNYDLAIASGAEDCGCGYNDPRDNAYAQIMYDHTRAHTSAEFARWMGELPCESRERIGGVEVHFVHGSPLAVNDFFWESLSDEQARLRVAASGAEVLMCTHTGLPWQRRIDGTLVVNVGTIGRSANDGRREGWYAVLEVHAGQASAELAPVAFDWRAQAAAIREAGLPEAFAESVESGWWTTCLEVLPPAERARGRYHVYRDAVPGFGAEAVGWADDEVAEGDGLPVTPLFGTAAFPSRLWIYTNFHCNLACSYCAVSSSPTADRRSLGLSRFRALVDEALEEGFDELYLTGGEPFLEPEIAAMIRFAAARAPTTVLTNAMLFTGRRRQELRELATMDGLTLQTSLDGPRAATHDRLRGRGSWQRAVDGIAFALSLGLRVSVATTQTDSNTDEIPALTQLLEELGVQPGDHAVRPLVARGFSRSGLGVATGNVVPELTVTADGIWWHPVGADRGSGTDMLVAEGQVALGVAKRAVVKAFLELRQADGSLAQPYACAIPAS